MSATSSVPRLLLVGLLAIGWLLGFAIHGASAAATGWADITPPLMLLGIVLCIAAGAVAWAVAPTHRRARYGALAGILMWISFIVGNVLVAVLWVDPAHAAESGETWWTFLLESWFWIGLPTLLSASLGAVGWLMARQLGGMSANRPAV